MWLFFRLSYNMTFTVLLDYALKNHKETAVTLCVDYNGDSHFATCLLCPQSGLAWLTAGSLETLHQPNVLNLLGASYMLE